MSLITIDDIKAILRKYRASLMKFLAAKTVGVITIAAGQFRPGFRKRFPKNFYYFIDNVVSLTSWKISFHRVWVILPVRESDLMTKRNSGGESST